MIWITYLKLNSLVELFTYKTMTIILNNGIKNNHWCSVSIEIRLYLHQLQLP